MKRYAIIASMVAIVAWGVGAVLDKTALNCMDGMSAASAQFVRFATATAALWLYGLLSGIWRQVPALDRTTWGYIALSGLLGVGIGGAAYLFAVQLGEVSSVAVFSSGYPILTVFLAAAFLREGLTWSKLVGTVMVVSGLIVLTLAASAPPPPPLS